MKKLREWTQLNTLDKFLEILGEAGANACDPADEAFVAGIEERYADAGKDMEISTDEIDRLYILSEVDLMGP